MDIAGTHVIWWLGLGTLFAFVLWGLVDGWVVAPRRARAKFAALQATLQRPVHQESAHRSTISWPVEDRVVAVCTQFTGDGGLTHVRGPRGRVFTLATPLRVPARAMHDLEIRVRRPTGAWETRFDVIESGVPVRDGWLLEPVRAAVTRFFDHPLAVGRLVTDRGELQHLAYWSDVGDIGDAVSVRDLLARFAAVAAVLDRAAARRHPVD